MTKLTAGDLLVTRPRKDVTPVQQLALPGPTSKTLLAPDPVLALPAPKVTSKSDFYVSPDGRILSSTAYRYMDSKYAEQTMRTMEVPRSYIGLSKFDLASKMQDAYQISPAWSNAKLRGEFDILQIMCMFLRKPEIQEKFWSQSHLIIPNMVKEAIHN